MYYVSVPEGGPDGIAVAPDGTVHFNTVGQAAGLKDPAQGRMYRMRPDDFKQGRLPQPFNQGLGALDGLDVAGSARLDTEIKDSNSILVTPFWTSRSYRLPLDQDMKLAGPADITVHRMEDGSYLVVIPELSATSPKQQGQPRHCGAAARWLRPLPAGHRRTDVAKRLGTYRVGK